MVLRFQFSTSRITGNQGAPALACLTRVIPLVQLNSYYKPEP